MGKAGGQWAAPWCAAALGLVILAQAPSCGGRAVSIEEAADDDDPRARGATANQPAVGGTATGGRGGTSGASSIGGKGGVGPDGGQAGVGQAGDGEAGGGATGGSAPGGTGGTGGSGKGGTSGGGDGGTGGRPIAGSCRNPSPWSSDLELCEDGYVHRVASTCSLPLRDSEYPDLGSDAGVEDLDECSASWSYFYCRLVRNECTRDADCGSNGYCLRDTEWDALQEDYYINHRCMTACTADADCGANEVCACDYALQNATRTLISLGTCRPATCKADAECGPESLCISPLFPTRPNSQEWPPSIPVVRRHLSSFHCQIPLDECYGPGSCGAYDPPQNCCYVPICTHESGHFACTTTETCDHCGE